MGESNTPAWPLIAKCLDLSDKPVLGTNKPQSYPGVYLWRTPLKVKAEELSIFFCEVVGFTEFEEEQKAKLLTILYSISSIIVYSSSGHIRNQTLEGMRTFSKLSQNIQVYDDHKYLSDIYLESQSPLLLWALRDLSGSFEDTKGNPISANQYLESSFAKLTNPNLLQTLESITNLFRRRSCLDFSSDKSAGFTSQKVFEGLKQTIITQVEVKQVEEISFSSSTLVGYLLTLVDLVNTNNFPINISQATELAASFDIRASLAKAKLNYTNSLRDSFGADNLFENDRAVEDKLDLIRRTSDDILSNVADLAAFQPEQYLEAQTELDTFIEIREIAVRESQQELKHKLGATFIENFERDVESKHGRGLYNSHNFPDFLKDISK